MAKLLNVNHDVYINCNYVSFLKNLIDKNKLNFGDIIGIIKNINNIKIIHLENKLLKPYIINNQIVIDKTITNYMYNPILYYHKLSSFIYHIAFSTKHILFKNILDSKNFSKLEFIFYYKTEFHIEIRNIKHNINILYKIDKLQKKDENLINLMSIMNQTYMGIKKEIKINIHTVDSFYRRLSKLPNYWKIQSCNQEFKNNNTFVTLELLIPECDCNIIDNILY